MSSRAAAVPVILVILAGPAAAQTPPAPSAPDAARVLVADRNAPQTREQLRQLLRQYPPSVSRVLALDPSLLSNQGYLAAYPQLAAFVAQQPEVAHNPAYFFGSGDFDSDDPQRQMLELWENVMAGTAVFAAFVTVTGLLAWLLKTFIDHRRWLHVSKVQTEAHNKLLDRLTGHEELLAYIQTPAGRRFLESAPVVDAGPRAITAPIGRVLWSAQAGMVLAFAGLGVNFASGRVNEFIQPPLFVIGVLAIALGVGFVLSAALAYALSRRFGLLEPRPHE